MTGSAPSLHTRLKLIHAAFQLLADDVGADILHIKGPAVATDLLDTVTVGTGEDTQIKTIPRGSGDADVLVRPEHVGKFLARLYEAGWIRKTHFRTGSAFGHALNVYHPELGNADVHRSYPGLPDAAFDTIWARRSSIELGHVACAVPDVVSQRLILLLHAARSGPHHRDRERAWHRASDDQRADVRALAATVGAGIGLAAALDELDDYRHHPEYELWRYFSTGQTGRLGEWHARWRAATTLPQKAAVVRAFVHLDTSLLEAEIGRPPTKADVRRRNLARWAKLVRELGSRLPGRGTR